MESGARRSAPVLILWCSLPQERGHVLGATGRHWSEMASAAWEEDFFSLLHYTHVHRPGQLLGLGMLLRFWPWVTYAFKGDTSIYK